MNAESHQEVLAKERETLGLSDDNRGSALSISGGGIRSATFALGALQGLAKRNLLNMDYMSTVSGGGYIGSWLTAWKHRRGGLDPVKAELARGYTPQRGHTAENADSAEPKEISYLRRYSNYLTPKLGITSFDFWAIIATIVRNILANWAVLLPALMSVLFLPRLYLAVIALADHYFFSVIYPDGIISGEGNYEDIALDRLSDQFIIEPVLPALAIVFFAIAQANVLRYLPGAGGVRHRRRDYFIYILAPLALSVLCLDIWNNLHFNGSSYGTPEWWHFAIGGLVAMLLGLALAMFSGLRFHWRIVPVALAGFLIPSIWAWLAYNFILWNENDSVFNLWYWAQYATYSLPLVLIGISGGIMLMAGLSSRFLGEADREWFARANGGIILFSLGWLIVSFAVLIAPNMLLALLALIHDTSDLSLSGLMSAFGVLLGWFVSRQGQKINPHSPFRALLVKASTLLFLLILIISLSLLTNALIESTHKLLLPLVSQDWGWIVFYQYSADAANWHPVSVADDGLWWSSFHWANHENIIATANPVVLLITGALLLALSVLTGYQVNTNTFSLQGMYRNRLIRAYLGASNDKRKANDFTGFDDNDDILLKDLDPTLKPYHVVNLALNLVGGPRLEWQQRKAASFIASPLYCGNKDLGYRKSSAYGGRDGMSLGTAVATSGAAASPNMGYHSSPITTFIMTLFNARLGIWQGNPKAAKPSRRSSPRSALTSLAGEALGRTTDEGNYVYLSDGGHFENLALYEMVSRQCTDILVLDGGCDPATAFEDLGNALRKINIDMGVTIEFLPGHIDCIREKTCRAALANIYYPNGRQPGRLIYVKPMLRGNESPSILSYATLNPTFPHEATSNQWFSESQTESYRLLGLTSILEISEGFSGSTLQELFEHIRQNSPSGSGSTETRALQANECEPQHKN